MNADKIANIFSTIVVLAIVTTIVAHPQSAKIVTATARGLADLIRAGMGKRR